MLYNKFVNYRLANLITLRLRKFCRYSVHITLFSCIIFSTILYLPSVASRFTHNIVLVLWLQNQSELNDERVQKNYHLIDSLLQLRWIDESFFVKHDWLVIGDVYWAKQKKQEALDIWQTHNVTDDFWLNIVAIQADRLNNQNKIAIDNRNIELLHKVQLLSPNRSDPYLFEAFIQLSNENWSTGETLIDQAVSLNSWHNRFLTLKLYLKIALLYENSLQRTVAIDMLEKGILQGELAFNENVSATIVKRALAESHRKLALMYQQEGKSTLAEKSFKAAITFQPENFWNYLSLTFIYEAHGEPQEKIKELFDEAITVAPTNVWPYVKAAEFYQNRNLPNEKNHYCDLAPSIVQKTKEWRIVCASV